MTHHFLVTRTLGDHFNFKDNDYGTDCTGHSNVWPVQRGLIEAMNGIPPLEMNKTLPRYDSIDLAYAVHRSCGTHTILDRVRRFTGYQVSHLGDPDGSGTIDLLENEGDTGKVLEQFLQERSTRSNRVTLIICGLPWVPELIRLGLQVNNAHKDMTLDELHYMFPHGYTYSGKVQ